MMMIDELFDGLQPLKGKEYQVHKNGLPEKAYKDLERLCQLFEQSSVPVREEIASRVSRDISYLFMVFSTSMAINAVRNTDKQLVIRGLEALAIENATDYRDSILRLVLLNHSATLIGANSEELIRFAARVALQNARDNLFNPFLERSPESKALQKFGIQEGMSADGKFTYTSV